MRAGYLVNTNWIIASTYLCCELTFVSNNRKHYDMIEGLQIFCLP